VSSYDILVEQSREAGQDQPLPTRGGLHGYYLRPENGWVEPNDFEVSALLEYAKAGWMPLRKYGTFRWDDKSIHRPYDHLFKRGGAGEMPVEQLVEQGWAYREYKVDGEVVQFPQLAGAKIPPEEDCPYCPARFPGHQLRHHIEGAHSRLVDAVLQADAANKMRAREQAAASAEAPSAATADTVVPAPSNDYVCGRCQKGFTHPMALAKHVKEVHKS